MCSLSKPISAILVLLSISLFSRPAEAKYAGGSGTADDPYQIATAKNLNDLGESPEDYNKHFILTDNIDLDPNLPGRKVFDKAVIAPDVNETTEWWRFDGTPFTGLFDGNGHTISHLTIKGGGSLGLFGQLGWWDAPGGEVKNLGLVDVNIIGSGYYVGGLVGFNGNRDRPGGVLANCYTGGAVSGHSSVGGLVGWNEGTVSQSYSTGVVGGEYDIGGLVGGNYEGSITTSYSTTSVSGETQVGGLVGQNVGHVTQCYSTGAVSGSANYVGGLVGNNGKRDWYSEAGTVTRCYSTGTVSGTDYVGGLVGQNYDGAVTGCYSTGVVTGNSRVGGLVGYHWGGTVTQCYSTGAVSGSSNVGGLVGYNWSTVSNCYSTGAVSGKSVVGGLVGENDESGFISDCYSTGAVSASEAVGGLVGSNGGTVSCCYSTGPVTGSGEYIGGLVGCPWVWGGAGWPGHEIRGNVSNCFWDIQTSGRTTSNGGTGKTTAEMQTAKTFLEAGWDFIDETANGTEDIWWILEGRDYPRLWWELVD